MNEQQLAQLIRNVKTAQQSLTTIQGSLAVLLADLQDLVHGEPVVTVTDDNPRLKQLVVYAKKKIMRADGDWVHWTDLRPAYRDRDQYGEPLWWALTDDADLETRTTLAGSRVRREVRYNPLI